MPIALCSSDFDIFCTPSSPRGLASSRLCLRRLSLIRVAGRGRSIRLKFLSVPPSSTSARSATAIVPLRQRIQHLVHADRLLLLEALMKLIALQHLRQRRLRRQPDHPLEPELIQPLGVVSHLGLLRVKDLKHLRLVGLGVLVDLLPGQRLARHIPSSRVPDQRRRIPNQKDDRMPELSESARSLRISTVCPRCRSGAVGSNPALIRIGTPDAR